MHDRNRFNNRRVEIPDVYGGLSNLESIMDIAPYRKGPEFEEYKAYAQEVSQSRTLREQKLQLRGGYANWQTFAEKSRQERLERGYTPEEAERTKSYPWDEERWLRIQEEDKLSELENKWMLASGLEKERRRLDPKDTTFSGGEISVGVGTTPEFRRSRTVDRKNFIARWDREQELERLRGKHGIESPAYEKMKVLHEELLEKESHDTSWASHDIYMARTRILISGEYDVLKTKQIDLHAHPHLPERITEVWRLEKVAKGLTTTPEIEQKDSRKVATKDNTTDVLSDIAIAIRQLKSTNDAKQINRYLGQVGVELTRGKWNPWSSTTQTTSVIPAPATQTTSVIPAPMRIDPGDVTNPTDFEYMP